ncbi:MAG: bifunctional diaminohydroxyphosphoribosylaminopyrimidine deaminase/5-amino-6-(5-phosphoribosylamino)uracil reductase RibD [Bacteroidetes bacterium]|nr:bifunctional diaminohydroxyphosphoribosylaminopyrimidine deaminase/5-amino-6-(5-phosphoribosylamino)uracil reductase RibD [Bacteroidota bacterium]MDA1084482.1 bifunctional diaminohydroxyphosphoribosylaminopyrimidine deaminase/5-amino-6-(5-phosphoribosylamino)uracil reductase RibD [Bacteroidota bacterium]
MHNKHNIFMQRCLTLAKKGLGYTYPNPMVGAVVVSDGNIISEGWHQKSGTAHAEVHALATLHQSDLKKATLYVNLEPCAHHGKTPPCCDLVIAKGIKKVIVGAQDPNPKVAGKGIKAMREAGIEVIVGVLQDACIELNKRFYCYHTQKRPYIILKWAQSADGFIAPMNDVKGKVTWISDIHSQQLAHRWRAEEHAILVGRKTVEADNPELTTRKWIGTNPIRLVFDPQLKIKENTNILNTRAKTIIFNEVLTKKEDNVAWEKIDGDNTLMSMLKMAHEHSIQSILVEGGAMTLHHFLKTNLWDECRVILSEKILNGGVQAPTIPKGKKEEKRIVGDRLHIIKR